MIAIGNKCAGIGKPESMRERNPTIMATTMRMGKIPSIIKMGGRIALTAMEIALRRHLGRIMAVMAAPITTATDRESLCHFPPSFLSF